MPQRDFIPHREAELVTFTANMAARLSAQPADYGITPALADEYSTAHDNWALQYERAQAPETRSPVAIAAKNTAKKIIIEQTRKIAKIVRATPGMDDQRLIELGLRPHKTEPTRIVRPHSAPEIDIQERRGNHVLARLHSEEGPRHKPQGVAAAFVYTHVGPTAPVRIQDWTFAGSYTRSLVDLAFDPTLPAGTTVWITACWVNPRGETGPGATAVSTVLAGGYVATAA